MRVELGVYISKICQNVVVVVVEGGSTFVGVKGIQHARLPNMICAF